MSCPEINPETGEVIFPDIPPVRLTTTQYTPTIDTNTGEINFPPIRQDVDAPYEQNICQTFDEVNATDVNKPTIILTIGTNSPIEYNNEVLEYHLTDYYYTHKLIKQLTENPNFVPLDIASRRINTTYADTTYIHLTIPRSVNQRFLYEHNLQTSSLLSYFFTSYPPII